MRDIWRAKPKCRCGGFGRKTTFNIEGFTVRGWKCSKCREEHLHPEDAEKALVFNKLRRGMKIRVGELGKATIIRIPQEFIQYYGIKKGAIVEVKAENKNRFAVEAE